MENTGSLDVITLWEAFKVTIWEVLISQTFYRVEIEIIKKETNGRAISQLFLPVPDWMA